MDDSEKSLKTFSVPKHDDTPNEDRWSVSADKKIIAVSDGASVSFDSARWAEALCRRFVADPIVTPEWVQSGTYEYGALYDREAMPWMQQGAFDRGSFATLLGVSFSNGFGSMRVLALGDSILAVLDRCSLVSVIPNMTVADFDGSPNLLSTNPAENDFLTAEYISAAYCEVLLAQYESPVCMLMTDALGRWLIEGPHTERVPSLLALETHEEFTELVDRERSAGRLKRDDTTLVVIG